jgi:ribosomal protein S18 acetylase RimI-like enzyme
MRLKLQPATQEDAEAIAALRNAVSDDLTFKHGRGGWTSHSTTAAVLSDLRHDQLLVALHRGEAIATLKLATRNPWRCDLPRFRQARRPLYLAALAVAPELQRQGHGRACLAEAVKIARRAKADVIFLEALDHPAAGAGDFCTKCGGREIGRTVDRAGPFIYYELKLGPAP